MLAAEEGAMNATYAYSRYLAAKRTVDDRALNKDVIERLRHQLSASPARRVLEIGAGLGTMVARLLQWNLLLAGSYTLLDVDAQLLADSRQWLQSELQAEEVGGDLHIQTPRGQVVVHFLQAELGDYLKDPEQLPVDLLICNAFLDLVDVAQTLPGLFGLLQPGGHYWFSINFDGETIFQPEDERDELFMSIYHRGMDQRLRYGRQAGESKTGRHLFHHLKAAGASPLAVGASDWVVHPLPDGSYPGDEAEFLGHILDTVEAGLRQQPEISDSELDSWLSLRRAQVAQGDLLYIAHQLDFVGSGPVNPAT